MKSAFIQLKTSKRIYKQSSKAIFFFKLFVICVVLFSSVNAQTKSSFYTEISDKNCQQVKNDPDNGILYDSICKGFGGYKITFTQGDLRQFIGIQSPEGKQIGPDLSKVNYTIFSYFDKKLEWRVIKKGKKIVPIAVIIDYKIYYTPDTPEEAESFLIIVKISKDSACLTNFIKPQGKNRKFRARKLADKALQQPCYKGEEIWRK